MFFGFSLAKILFTVAVVVAIWQGFKFLGRLQDAKLRQRKADALKRGAGNGNGNGKQRRSARADHDGAGKRDQAEDLVECAVCGSFVVASEPAVCGRGDCPYSG